MMWLIIRGWQHAFIGPAGFDSQHHVGPLPSIGGSDPKLKNKGGFVDLICLFSWL